MALAQNTATPSSDRARALNWRAVLERVGSGTSRAWRPFLQESIALACAVGDGTRANRWPSAMPPHLRAHPKSTRLAAALLQEALLVSQRLGLKREMAWNLGMVGALLAVELPMWVGGASRGALKRAATLGDGWHPNGLSPDDYRAGVEQITEMATAAGRDPGQIYLSLRANIRLNPPVGAAPSRFDGSSEDMVNAIGDYGRVGVEHVVLAPDSGDVARVRDKMDQIARDVIPAFR